MASTPKPLLSDISKDLEYPIDSLGKLLGAATKATIECSQVPESIAAQSILTAAALAVQGFANVEIDGRIIPISLFALTIAESGDRKTAADNIALKQHTDIQKRLLDEYEAAMRDFDNEQIAYDVEINKIKRQKGISQEERATLLKNTHQPIKPTNPTLIVQEPSLEGLQKSFEIGIPSQGLFNDEGGQFFGGYAMNPDNALKSMAGLSKFWDGKEITRTRANENVTLYDKRLSIHLMAQPIVAEKVLRDPILQGQGFIPRFLVCWPQSIAGTRNYQEKNAYDDIRIIKYQEAMKALITKAVANNKLRTITLSNAAKSIWIESYNEIESKLGRNSEFAEIRATGSKAAEVILRIAAVLTLVENSEATTIDEADMFQAITLGTYYQYEALRLMTENKLNLVLPRAQLFLEWLQDESKVLYSTRHMYRHAPAEIGIKKGKKAAMELIAILVEYGWLKPASEDTIIDGKKCKEAWELQSILEA